MLRLIILKSGSFRTDQNKWQMHSVGCKAQAQVWALEKLLSTDPTSLENLQGSRTVGRAIKSGKAPWVNPESTAAPEPLMIKIWKFRGDWLP